MNAWTILAVTFLGASDVGPAALSSEGLTHLKLDTCGVEIFYPASHSNPIKSPPAWTREYAEAGVSVSVPIVLHFNGIGDFTLSCDSGPSADPRCLLLRDAMKPDEPAFEAPGMQFVFLPDGRVFVGGHTDNLYDQRRLYRFDGKRFVETAQPMRYVGVEAKAKSAIVLHASTAPNSPTTLTLAAGSAFTILLNDNSRVDDNGQNADYLVRTPEGIVGWAHLPTHDDGSTDAEGLFFAGD